jgi:hypothetical protein
MIREYTCSRDTSVGYGDFTCPNGCQDGACMIATCESLKKSTSSLYYFDSCRNSNGGFNKVCFDKYTGIYQGCGNSSDDCTVNNVNAARNISCDVGANMSIVLTGPTSLKTNQTGEYVASVRGGTPPYNTYWSIDGKVAYNNTALSATYNWTTPGLKIINVTTTDSRGQSVNATINVTVSAITSNLSANLTSTSCSNGSVTVSVAPSGGSGVYQLYQFYADGVVKTASDSNFYTFTGLSNGSHTLYATVRDSANATVISNTVGATCSTIASTCTDSDGGNNPYVKGSLTYINNPYGVLKEMDICEDNYTLEERVCNSQTDYTQNHIIVACPSGYNCTDGACKQALSTLKPDLMIPYQFGMVYSLPGANPKVGDAYTYFDVTVKNIGAASIIPTNGSYTELGVACALNNYPSNITNFNDPNIILGVTLTPKSLASNESSTAYKVPTIANSSLLKSAGNKHIFCTVDQLNKIDESNESNNQYDFWITVDPNSTVSTTVTTATRPISGCSWCGGQCVLSSGLSGQYCTNIMPPVGKVCTMINNICTVVSGGTAVQGAETHVFEVNLGYGMEGDDVKILQSLLAQKGYFSGVVSGYFGWQTEEAVKTFQTANNLPVTGLVGPLTRELLNK